MKVSVVQCKKCGDIIWSRTDHDYRSCTCESVSVDGGFSYTRIIGEEKDYKIFELDLDVTKADAVLDWKFGANKLGKIHTDDNTEFVENL